MAAVPRSRGCRTCVQRRIRCDLGKPICNNCTRGGRDCFFMDDFKFRDEGIKIRKRFANGTPSQSSEIGALPPATSTPPVELSVGPRQSHSASQLAQPVEDRSSESANAESEQWRSSRDTTQVSTPARSAQYPEDASSVPMLESVGFLRKQVNSNSEAERWLRRALWKGEQSVTDPLIAVTLHTALLSPYLMQEQLLDLFHNSLKPRNQTWAVPQQLRSHGRWLQFLPDLTGRNPLLDNAVRAVSLAHLGRLYGSESCLQESRPYYGKAIRLLNAAISDFDNGMASETLSATMLLSFYEMFASNSNDSWIKHAGGAGALMRMRGPQSHRYGFARDAFLAGRFTIIIESFHKDEPCFLNEPEWLKLSRDIFNDMAKAEKGNEFMELIELAEEFYEIMVKIPALLSDARNFYAAWLRESVSFPSPSLFIKDLTRRIVNTRSELKIFFARFEGSMAKIKCGYTSYTSNDSVITRYHLFPNVFIASTCTGFWTNLIILNFLLIELQRVTAPENGAVYRLENQDIALQICRSTPYMLTSSFIGPLFCIFGLRICLACLEDAAQREWVIRKLSEIAKTHMAMAAHIPGHELGSPVPRLRVSLAPMIKVADG